MSLSLALNNAISGLNVTQQALSVLSQNIANANNPDYSRQIVNQTAVTVGGQYGSGVAIASVTRAVNDYISQSVVTSNTAASGASTVNQYYNQIQNYLGQPGASNSIDTYTNAFFNAVSQLQTSPTTSSLKLTAVNAAQTLAQQVSSLATNLQSTRYQADQQISQSVGSINSDLQKIYGLNAALLSAQTLGDSVNGLQDTMQATLKDLSGYMDITYKTDSNGAVQVSTTNGIALTGPSAVQLEYTPVASVADLENNTPINPIKVYSVNADGDKAYSSINLAEGGPSSQVTTNLTGGSLYALMQVRDKLMPDTLGQLDNFAANLRDTVNAISNNGTSYPPQQSMTGTTLVSPTGSQNWSGSVMIAALNPDGSAVASPYASDTTNGVGMAPLTLNLGSLNSGTSAGKPTYQSIIDQINQYYGVPQPRAEMNGLTNIQLVSNSDSLTAGAGTFNFGLSLTNLGATDTSVQITGATISGGGTISFPSSSYTAKAGTDTNTTGTIDLSANMSASGPGPYTITLNVQTTDASGAVTNGTVSYVVNNAPSGLQNNEYSVNTVGGSATKENPTSNKPILTAKLVDANGVEIAKDVNGNYTGSGYLQISGANGTTTVAINQLDSSANGDVNARPPVVGTQFGFSQYFGLNNLFVDNGKVANAAVNMQVRADIIANPQNLQVGKLTSNAVAGSTKADYTYSVGNASTGTLDSIINLSQNTINFKASGTMPTVSMSFTDYAGQILGLVSQQTANSKDNLTQTQLIQQGFTDQDNSTRGVNIDEEMANTILYQNAYSANARVLTVTNQLFQDLLGAFTQ